MATLRKQKEKSFERRVVSKLEKWEGVLALPKSHPMGVKGILDRIFCVRGVLVSLEFKRSKSAKRDAMQKYYVKAINDAGGFAAFIYPENEEEVLASIKEILEKRAVPPNGSS